MNNHQEAPTQPYYLDHTFYKQDAPDGAKKEVRDRFFACLKEAKKYLEKPTTNENYHRLMKTTFC